MVVLKSASPTLVFVEHCVVMQAEAPTSELQAFFTGSVQYCCAKDAATRALINANVLNGFMIVLGFSGLVTSFPLDAAFIVTSTNHAWPHLCFPFLTRVTTTQEILGNSS